MRKIVTYFFFAFLVISLIFFSFGVTESMISNKMPIFLRMLANAFNAPTWEIQHIKVWENVGEMGSVFQNIVVVSRYTHNLLAQFINVFIDIFNTLFRIVNFVIRMYNCVIQFTKEILLA